MSDRETLPGWCGLLALRGDGHPFVIDADGQRTLQFDGLTIQSQMALDDPDALALDYTRTMMGFLLFHPAPRHVAMIGLGGGSLLKYCFKTMPETRVTAVEINPEVIALRDAFGIPPDGSRLRVTKPARGSARNSCGPATGSGNDTARPLPAETVSG